MPLNIPELAQMAADLYGPTSRTCDLSWTYHNSDGSLSDICGNGLRCLALWAKNEKNMDGELKVATALGPLTLNYLSKTDITLTLGAPKLQAKDIPFLTKNTGQIIKENLKLGNIEFPITCVNVGNPHCIIFDADFIKPDLFKSLSSIENKMPNSNFFPTELIPVAEALEVDSRFPEGTNVEFVNVINRTNIQVFVWERGSKATLACGSAAAATAVASILEIGQIENSMSPSLVAPYLLIGQTRK